jgi:hypothetical protein
LERIQPVGSANDLMEVTALSGSAMVAERANPFSQRRIAGHDSAGVTEGSKILGRITAVRLGTE